MSRYRPLSDYGMIGDCRTAALVSGHGEIDWWCPERFDAPSVFARLLDHERGGTFVLRPSAPAERAFGYAGRTNVLRTTWQTERGRAVVHDLMPLDAEGGPFDGRSRLLRIASCEQGEVEMEVLVAPRPDYGRTRVRISREAGGFLMAAGGLRLALSAPAALEAREAADAVAGRVRVTPGSPLVLSLAVAPPSGLRPLQHERATEALRTTTEFWRAWSERTGHQGAYAEAVGRSALALKLLTHAPTGALVAAPTTSLPEDIGGVRNWDYRYAWVRDTAFAALAFHQAGHAEDATQLAHWAGGRVERVTPGELRIVYRIDGSSDLDEEELPHLEGYRGSAPVRIGNDAVRQWQLDVYGELVDTLHICRVLGVHEEESIAWPQVRELIEYVRQNWRKADSGIWEMRSQPRHFVVSKLFSWVAMDRGVRAIEDLGLDGPLDAWRVARREIRDEILDKGYDAERRSFRMAYGSAKTDAATLLVPLVGLLPARDERVRGTVDRVIQELSEDGLVYRYRGVDDGIAGTEATFATCTGWLAEVLAQMGEVARAREVLDGLLSHRGPAGLLAEEIDPASGEQLGNYPQGLTLTSVINAAAAIARAEAGETEAAPLRDPDALLAFRRARRSDR